MIILAILSKKSLRSDPTFILIVAQSFAGIVVAIFTSTQVIISLLYGNVFGTNFLLCDIFATFVILSICVTLVNMGIIAFNRSI